MIKFQTLLSDFFAKYLGNQINASENTIKNYKVTFVELIQYIKTKKNIVPNKIKIETLDQKTILDFLDWLEHDKKVSISTRNNRLAAIRSFFKYVSFREPAYLIQCAFIAEIKKKKTETKPVNYLTIPAFQYLISLPDRNDRSQLRDLCIIALLYESGARVSELINIGVLELRLSTPHTLVLHGKGKKTRIVPIDNEVAKLLKHYIKVYKIHDDDYLFFNSRREKLTREGVNYILQKWFNKAKEKEAVLFPDRISPHSLRHSKAMHLLENDVNLIYIRDLLGHSSVTTTEIYSKANPEIKRKHIENATKTLIGDETDYSQSESDDLLEWLKNNI